MATNFFREDRFKELFTQRVLDTVEALSRVGKKDLFRAVRPEGEGSFKALLFQDYGPHSWIAAERELCISDGMRALEEFFSGQPSVLHVDCGDTLVAWRQSARDWVLSYLAANFDLVERSREDVEARVRNYCEEVGDALDRGSFTVTAATLIASIRLPIGISRIDLPCGARIRKFEPHEIERLSRHDASREGGLSIQELSHAVALECEFECPLEIVADVSPGQKHPSIYLDQRHRVERFLDALSIVLPHRCEAMQTSWELGIKGLPVILGTQSRLGVLALGLAEVGEPQIEQIVATYALVPTFRTGHIGVAASRLTSAERRLERSDQLLDAVIGLEALLAPRDSGELSFRLALNYALLGEISARRERFERMASVLEVRNMLVHGATLSSEKHQARLSDAAILACSLLRDALQSVCNASKKNGLPTFDKEYWLTNLLGPKT